MAQMTLPPAVAAEVRKRKNWLAHAFDTGVIGYFQQPAAFFQQWDTFLAR